MMNITPEQVQAGQAVYTKQILSIYDWFVIGFSNRYIWQCPSPILEKLYNHYVSANHLDVGVGTGYFLDRCQFPSSSPRVALMDINKNTLEYASQRIARYQPETYQHNILEPISINVPKFDSVGVNYLLHCLPSSIPSKAVIFDNLKQVMNPNAIIFGSTILPHSIDYNFPAKILMNFYNKKGIFCNQNDDFDALNNALEKRFNNINLQLKGCVALFSANC